MKIAEGRRQKAEGRRRSTAFCLLLSVSCLLGGAGCRSTDKLEAELRRRDAELREVRDELCQSQLLNESMQRELHHVEQNTPGGVVEVHAVSTVNKIALGRQTGGYREDCAPGDTALQVVLEPKDCDGHTIKAPGTLRVLALEISSDGLKNPLSNWEIPTEQLRHDWKSGLWSSGYFVILPWKTPPTQEKMRVVAQFVLPDGRVFEADKDVTLHLPPANSPKAAPPPAPAPAETLPPPKPLPAENGEGPALSESRYKPTSGEWMPLTPPVSLGRPQK